MANHEQARNQLLKSFEEGAGGTTISADARAWLHKFCEDWMKDPPSSGGRTIADLWDDEHGGPPPNGQKFKGRFKKIGKAAASKCDVAGTKEITETDVETATKEVISQSACPFCPDE